MCHYLNEIIELWKNSPEIKAELDSGHAPKLDPINFSYNYCWILQTFLDDEKRHN